MGLRAAKVKSFFRSLVRKNLISILKLFVGIIVVLLFSIGSYYIFLGIFRYLKDVQDIGPLIADKIVSLGFLVFFFMLAISNGISAITTIFRSNETHFLLSLPIRYEDVFQIRFTDNVLYSSWSTLVVGIPLILSFARVYAIKTGFLPFIFLFGLIPFVIIPGYIGSAFTMLLFILTSRVGFKNSLAILITIAGAILLYFFRSSGATT
ncbi:MAG: putative ABC transporter permease subunit, partial [bacterium]